MMNEGARQANEQMYRQTVKNNLNAILKELRLIREVLEKQGEAVDNEPLFEIVKDGKKVDTGWEGLKDNR